MYPTKKSYTCKYVYVIHKQNQLEIYSIPAQQWHSCTTMQDLTRHIYNIDFASNVWMENGATYSIQSRSCSLYFLIYSVSMSGDADLPKVTKLRQIFHIGSTIKERISASGHWTISAIFRKIFTAIWRIHREMVWYNATLYYSACLNKIFLTFIVNLLFECPSYMKKNISRIH